jgi:hypothetical protein
MKIGRNDPCHCGSGKKYKKCCNSKDEAARSAELAAEAAARASTAAEDQPAPQQEQGRKAGGVSPKAGQTGPRPKGPPPKSPTQLRRRDV